LLTENLCCCTIQALFIFLLLPFLSNLKGIPFAELPAYLTRGAACFLNVGGNLKGEYCFSYHIHVVNKWSFSYYIISNLWLIREKVMFSYYMISNIWLIGEKGSSWNLSQVNIIHLNLFVLVWSILLRYAWHKCLTLC
jgi:hypothetical protein